MADKDKVIKGLEYHLKELSVGKTCFECPYLGDNPCEIQLIADAISLLKEQEPKTGKWILDDEDANSWECSECGGLTVINYGTPHENNWYFCPCCGAKLEEQVMKME